MEKTKANEQSTQIIWDIKGKGLIQSPSEKTFNDRRDLI